MLAPHHSCLPYDFTRQQKHKSCIRHPLQLLQCWKEAGFYCKLQQTSCHGHHVWFCDQQCCNSNVCRGVASRCFDYKFPAGCRHAAMCADTAVKQNPAGCRHMLIGILKLIAISRRAVSWVVRISGSSSTTDRPTSGGKLRSHVDHCKQEL